MRCKGSGRLPWGEECWRCYGTGSTFLIFDRPDGRPTPGAVALAAAAEARRQNRQNDDL